MQQRLEAEKQEVDAAFASMTVLRTTVEAARDENNRAARALSVSEQELAFRRRSNDDLLATLREQSVLLAAQREKYLDRVRSAEVVKAEIDMERERAERERAAAAEELTSVEAKLAVEAAKVQVGMVSQ